MLPASFQHLVLQGSYALRAVQLCWRATRGWTLVWGLVLVLQGLLPVVLLPLTRLLIDRLVQMVGTGGAWQSFQPLWVPGVLMVGVLLATELLHTASDWLTAVRGELVRDYVSALVHRKSTMVDFAFYESPEYYDRLEQTRSDAGSRVLSMLEQSGTLVQSSITLVGMGGLLLPYGRGIPLLLCAGVLPAFGIALFCNRQYYQWWTRTTAARRRTHYYDTVLTFDEYAAEVRLFDLGAYFQTAYQTLRQCLRTERLHLLKTQGLVRVGGRLLALLTAGGIMAWMVWQVGQGSVTLGDLTLFYQALNQGQSLLQTLLGNLSTIYNHTLFLHNLFAFLALPEQAANAAQPLLAPPVMQEGIRFEHVTFRYPGSTQPALQDFSLTIPAGQLVAIVGANGAGKSTLLKLLCRLYDPEAGRITLDSTDIRYLALPELRRLITVLFQFPAYYHATAAENVALGDLKMLSDRTALTRAAEAAGAQAFIDRLPHGYDTLLGKWFADGTELSGGEWQRLALARAFLRQAPVILLDEPTSFMDSWAETEWLKRVRVLVQGRTTLMITHRFTTAMHADVIHVMQHGSVVESGSHCALLAQGGLYAQSWQAQVHGAGQSAHSIVDAASVSVASRYHHDDGGH